MGGWGLSQRDHVRNDAAPVRESVLDQKTLKEPIHSRDREWDSLCLFICFPASTVAFGVLGTSIRLLEDQDSGYES